MNDFIALLMKARLLGKVLLVCDRCQGMQLVEPLLAQPPTTYLISTCHPCLGKETLFFSQPKLGEVK